MPTPSVEATSTGSSKRPRSGRNMPPNEPISVRTEGLKVARAKASDAGLGGVSGGDVDTGVAIVHTGFTEFSAIWPGPGCDAVRVVPGRAPAVGRRRAAGSRGELRWREVGYERLPGMATVDGREAATLESQDPRFGNLENQLETRRLEIETALAAWFPQTGSSGVVEAARYSLFAPAKRLRPILSTFVAELLGGDSRRILPAACAVEMVHTSSLILDDLPCMDDATLRRGRATCHVRFGEATAVLAAFALLNRAFEILAAGWPGSPIEAGRLALARDLAAAVGLDGMIAGQHRDLEMTEQPLDFGTLEFIHSRKTGALFMASAAVGVMATRASEGVRTAVLAYAKNLGLAFQIVDDVIGRHRGS